MAAAGDIDLGISGLSLAVEIGRDGFAVVYRAFQPAFERYVAVKVFGDLALDKAAPAVFERECRAIGRVSGRSNILTVHEAGMTASGLPYMVMAYMARGSLAGLVERDGPLPWWQAVAVGMKLAKALNVAHEAGVLHRDVKPDNVLISDDGEPLLADFGIARLTDVVRKTMSRPAFTPAHAPPEVLAGEQPTAAVDIYSLGSTLFVLMVGRPAFVERADDPLFVVMSRVMEGSVPDLLRPRQVPDPVCRLIETAMAKDPADRPATAATFARQLGMVYRESRQEPVDREVRDQSAHREMMGQRDVPVRSTPVLREVSAPARNLVQDLNTRRADGVGNDTQREESPLRASRVAPAPSSANDACPCGNGKKFKFCHGLIVSQPDQDVHNGVATNSTVSVARSGDGRVLRPVRKMLIERGGEDADLRMQREFVEHKELVLSSLAREYPDLREVLDELSEDELEVAWGAVERLDKVLASDDRPLMAWGVTSPASGLLLACTWGFMFCPNQVAQEVALWPRRVILRHEVTEDAITLHLRNGESIDIRTVEDEGDLLVDAIQAVCSKVSPKQLVRLFEGWRAETESEPEPSQRESGPADSADVAEDEMRCCNQPPVGACTVCQQSVCMQHCVYSDKPLPLPKPRVPRRFQQGLTRAEAGMYSFNPQSLRGRRNLEVLSGPHK